MGSLFYGVPKAIIDGEFNQIYNNDFNKWLEKSNQGIDNTFKVYMSDSERNGSFFDQTIGSANFWTKSLLGDGMSFTAGAVLSAYAMGGIGSLVGVGSKAVGLTGALEKGISSIGEGLSKVNTNMIEGFGQAKWLSNAANTLKGASSAFTGSEAMGAAANAAK